MFFKSFISEIAGLPFNEQIRRIRDEVSRGMEQCASEPDSEILIEIGCDEEKIEDIEIYTSGNKNWGQKIPLHMFECEVPKNRMPLTSEEAQLIKEACLFIPEVSSLTLEWRPGKVQPYPVITLKVRQPT